MKAKEETIVKLSEKAKRQIESELGIFLTSPKNPLRTAREQHGVFDEGETFSAI